MNNAITEIKNTLEGSNSRITEAEKRITEMEERMVEINEAQRKKEKELNEENLRDLWDKVKCPNIQIIGVPEEDQQEGHEKMLEEIIVKNFPKMRNEIATQVQENLQSPKQDKPKMKHPKTHTY